MCKQKYITGLAEYLRWLIVASLTASQSSSGVCSCTSAQILLYPPSSFHHVKQCCIKSWFRCLQNHICAHSEIVWWMTGVKGEIIGLLGITALTKCTVMAKTTHATSCQLNCNLKQRAGAASGESCHWAIIFHSISRQVPCENHPCYTSSQML